MAIPNILLGRVESDPMRIPTAASMAFGRDDRFDRLLRDAVATDEPRPRVEARPQDEPQAPAPDEFADEIDAPQRHDSRDLDRGEAAADVAEQDTTETSVEPAAEVTDTIQKGEPERQGTTGKAADSPRTSVPSAEQPVATGGLPSPNAAANAMPVAAQPIPAGVQPTAATGTTEPVVRGAEGLAARGSMPGKTAAAQAGYATRNAASAQLMEQARDSVFKQILMKLSGDGGEMRMRLEPPELGELDLRLTVESGNRLSLAIAAERTDIAHLLHKHLDELKQTLQENGLEVTGAEVQTRSEFAEQRRRSEEQQNGGFTANDHAEEAASAPRTRGYVTATGLDFWA